MPWMRWLLSIFDAVLVCIGRCGVSRLQLNSRGAELARSTRQIEVPIDTSSGHQNGWAVHPERQFMMFSLCTDELAFLVRARPPVQSRKYATAALRIFFFLNCQELPPRPKGLVPPPQLPHLARFHLKCLPPLASGGARFSAFPQLREHAIFHLRKLSRPPSYARIDNYRKSLPKWQPQRTLSSCGIRIMIGTL